MSRASAASGSQTMSTSGSPQKPDVVVKCACGLDAVRLISHTITNPNRPFYRCPNAPREGGTGGCRYFIWENMLPASNSQAGVPQTPSSSQSYSQSSSQARTPGNAFSAFSSPSKPWTNQAASGPSATLNPSKRKRSPSPPPVPRTPASLPASGSGKLSDERRALIFAELSKPSAGGDSRDQGSPTKRVKLDASSEVLSDDEVLWGTSTESIFRAGLEGDLPISSAQRPPASGGRSVSFNEDDVEDQKHLIGGVAKKLDFTRMRAGPPTNGPVLEDDPSNPFIVTPSTTKSTITAAGSLHNGTSSSTNPLSVISQLEGFLPQLVAVLPELKRQIRTSIEAKDKRIKELEREVARQKGEIQWLTEENAKLQKGA